MHKKFDPINQEWNVHDSSETQCVATVAEEYLADAIVDFLNSPAAVRKLQARRQIIVELDGGVIQNVILPEDLVAECQVYSVDWDTQDANPGDYLRFWRGGGRDRKLLKAFVSELDPSPANDGLSEGELAVRAFLEPLLQIQVPDSPTRPVEFLIAFTDKTWDTRTYDVYESVEEDQLRTWFQTVVMEQWTGPDVAGFDVYHIGDRKEEA